MADEQTIPIDTDLSQFSQKPLICRFCKRIMAFVTSLGDFVAPDIPHEPCDECRPFEERHQHVKNCSDTFDEVKHRSRAYGLRMQAVAVLATARRLFADFLLRVEYVEGVDYGDVEDDDESDEGDENEGEDEEEEEQSRQSAALATSKPEESAAIDPALEQTIPAPSTSGTPSVRLETATAGESQSGSSSKKDRRPSSPTIDSGSIYDSLASGSRKKGKRPSSPAAGTGSVGSSQASGFRKRARLRLDLFGTGKRVQFDPALNTAEDKAPKSMAELATKQSGQKYLDTSGYNQSYSAYHRVRKIKGIWVQLPDEEENKEEDETMAEADGSKEQENTNADDEPSTETQSDSSTDPDPDTPADSMYGLTLYTEEEERVQSMNTEQLLEYASQNPSEVKPARQRAIRRRQRDLRKEGASSSQSQHETQQAKSSAAKLTSNQDEDMEAKGPLSTSPVDSPTPTLTATADPIQNPTIHAPDQRAQTDIIAAALSTARMDTDITLTLPATANDIGSPVIDTPGQSDKTEVTEAADTGSAKPVQSTFGKLDFDDLDSDDSCG